MKFHPLFAGRLAMGLTHLDENAPGIIATQSTHKQLASFSQASQIHVKDRHIRGQKRRVEHRRFNQSFMQHASTSPFAPLFASLDVGAQMIKGRSGEVLWDKHIQRRKPGKGSKSSIYDFSGLIKAAQPYAREKAEEMAEKEAIRNVCANIWAQKSGSYPGNDGKGAS